MQRFAAVLGVVLILAAALLVDLWLRRQKEPGSPPAPVPTIGLVRIAPEEAPAAVQEAAALLAGTRVAYAFAGKDATYLVISAGAKGPGLNLGVARWNEAALPGIDVVLESRADADRLIVARLDAAPTDLRAIRFPVIGEGAGPGEMLPRLINPDGLSPVGLADGADVIILSPQPNERLSGTAVEVVGFARVPEGRLEAYLLGGAKSRPVGEAHLGQAAASSPDWGSFRIQLELPADPVAGDVHLVVSHPDGDARAAVIVRLGSK